jgi:hypothetical protein
MFYSFVAPASGSVKIITGGTRGDKIEAAIYDACNGNEIACYGQSNVKLVNGLTGGQTYILQVWHDDYYAGPFNIVLEEGPQPPANDDCSGAESLTVYPWGGGAGNETNASTLAATASSMSQTSCDSYGTNLDLFYSFVTPSNGGVAIITGGPGGSRIEAAIYDACNGNEVACFGQSSLKLADGLNPGQTYILQVWHDDSNANDFTIVLEELPPPPANNDCSGAIDVPVTASCSPVTGSNVAATDSGIPDPGCANYQGGDVWFKTTVPSDGNVDIETTSVSGSSLSDTGMAVYSGDCNSLSLIECNDDGGSGFFSKVSLTGRTPGEIIYIRVWEYGNNTTGDFGVCAYNPNVSVEEVNALGFVFYPNPASDELFLSAGQSIERVQVTNLAGQVLINIEPGTDNYKMDISGLPAGMYLMTVQVDGKTGTYRLIKK